VRAKANEKNADFAQSISDYTRAAALDPQDASIRNALARLLATCPEPEYRNGETAMEQATTACNLTGWQDGFCLDTLATAAAECGRFDDAIQWQQRALDIVSEPYKDQFQARLELYRKWQTVQ
jgi:serine/threonine-protein kinase